jgi:hypothetical protein
MKKKKASGHDHLPYICFYILAAISVLSSRASFSKHIIITSGQAYVHLGTGAMKKNPSTEKGFKGRCVLFESGEKSAGQQVTALLTTREGRKERKEYTSTTLS